MLCCVQHQKGATVAIGVAVVVVLARAFDGGATGADRRRSIYRAFPRLVAGAFCVAVPCLSIAMAMAGIDPVFDALVTTLRDYAAYHHQRASWAQTYLISAQVLRYSNPIVVRWAAPIVLVLAVVQAAIRWRSNGRRDVRCRSSGRSCSLSPGLPRSLTSPTSSTLPSSRPCSSSSARRRWKDCSPSETRWGRAGGLAVAAAIALALGINCTRTRGSTAGEFPIVGRRRSATVAYAHPRELWLLDRVDRELTETGDRQLFFYPVRRST